MGRVYGKLLDEEITEYDVADICELFLGVDVVGEMFGDFLEGFLGEEVGLRLQVICYYFDFYLILGGAVVVICCKCCHDSLLHDASQGLVFLQEHMPG